MTNTAEQIVGFLLAFFFSHRDLKALQLTDLLCTGLFIGLVFFGILKNISLIHVQRLQHSGERKPMTVRLQIKCGIVINQKGMKEVSHSRTLYRRRKFESVYKCCDVYGIMAYTFMQHVINFILFY